MGLAPELIDELERLTLPFSEEGTPSDAELRIAQAQLVGVARGPVPRHRGHDLAQQMQARAQFEQMRKALPPSATPPGSPGEHPGTSSESERMYL